MNFASEFLRFLAARRRLWMLPLFVVLVGIGGLLMLAHGTVVAPFIYSIF